MKRTNRILALILALVMALALAACGNGAGTGNTPSTTAPETSAPETTAPETTAPSTGDKDYGDYSAEIYPCTRTKKIIGKNLVLFNRYDATPIETSIREIIYL